MGTILLFLFSFRSQAFGHQVDRCHGSWGYLLTCMVMMLVSGMGMFTLVMTMVVDTGVAGLCRDYELEEYPAHYRC